MVVKKTRKINTRLNIKKHKTKHKTKTILKLLHGGQYDSPPPPPSLEILRKLVSSDKLSNIPVYENTSQFLPGTGFHPSNKTLPPPLLYPRTVKSVIPPPKPYLPPSVNSLAKFFGSAITKHPLPGKRKEPLPPLNPQTHLKLKH